MENLDTALAALIETALAGIDTSVDFLQAELPDVIVQLLMWHGVYSGVWFGVGIVFIMAFFFVLRRCKDIRKDSRKDYEDGKKWARYHGGNCTSNSYDAVIFCSYISPIICLAVGIIMTTSNLTWLQIWIAPKVWLLEYAANLVK